jgi:hypothetical protein
MKQNQHFVHGGDVQALSCRIPANAKKISHKPIALGEQSGHMHIVTGDVTLFEDENGNIFCSVGADGATLQHVHESTFDGKYDSQRVYAKADHKPVTLKPNTDYKFGIHKRYNPLARHWEKVKD